MAKNKLLLALLGVIVVGIGGGLLYTRFASQKTDGEPAQETQQTEFTSAGASPSPSLSPGAEPSPGASLQPQPDASGAPKASNPNPDLTVDANGLSKATAVMTTTRGVIKFKFYPSEAPGTVKRIIELTHQGFYNGLAFHRVIPGFSVQVGDPQGSGTGGSGQKLKAEFSDRKHVEGTMGMARGADPDSADSQFYIVLAPSPHLDRGFTVFAQVIEGMDVAKKIQIGDKVTQLVIE